MVESKYKQDFQNWCKRERIKISDNKEIFFINKSKTFVPMFKIGANIFVHIVDTISEKDADFYQSFATSFYPLMVIPKDVIDDLVKHFSRKDIATHFNLNI